MEREQILWWVFGAVVALMLFLDLMVFNRKAHEVKIKEALIWSAVWIGLSLIFNVVIYFVLGSKLALQFLAGYLIEKSLSVDNLFVFLLIFSYFGVPAKYQHRVLFWGILGAVVTRMIFIFAGVKLIEKFEWTIYVFGVFLIVTGVRMLFKKDDDIHMERNLVMRLFRPLTDYSKGFDSGRFFHWRDRRLWLTPLFVVLLVVESSDVVFAVDSVPAVLAVSKDMFIIYSSNVFAILGLRALYFALAGLMGMFHYLKYGLAFILSFVGVKMLAAHELEKHGHEIPISIALGVIALALLVSILASVIRERRERAKEEK